MSSARILSAAARLATSTPSARYTSSALCRSSIAKYNSLNATRQSSPVAWRACFGTTVRRSSEHKEETFEEFNTRVENEFNGVNDVFELQRNLNNAFAYDLVPSPSVITAALKAARRVNDFPTAVRIFEGTKPAEHAWADLGN
jgi:cytochrome c oxidase subunit 5a